MVGNIVSSTLWGSTAFKGILQRDVTVIIDEDCGEAASTEYKVADECVYDGALDSGTDFMLFTDMRLPLEIVQGMASIPQQVECGGGACFECVVDKDCLLNSDCQSQVCAAEEVKVPNLFELMGRLDIWNTFVWMASNLNMQLQVSGYGQEMGYPSLDLVDEPSESGKTCQTAVEDLAFQLQAKDGLVTFEGEIVDLSPFTPGFGTGAGILTGAGDLSDITETKTDGPLTVGFGADPSSGTATMAFITRGDGPGTIEFTIRSAGAESTEFFDIHPGTVVGPVAFTLDPASFGEDTLFNIIFTGPASRANVQFRATFTARTTPEESADIAEMKRIFSAEVNSQIAQIAVGTAEVNRLWDQLHAPITIRPRPPTITFPEFPAAPEITPPPTVTVTTCTYPDGFMVVYSGQWAEPWAMNMIYGESGETTLLPGEDNTVACHWIPSEHEFELSAGYGSCADFVRDGLEAQSGFSDCVAAVKQNLVSPESLVLEATLRGGFAEGLTLISTQGFTTFVVGNTDESSQTISQPYTGPVGPEGEIPWECTCESKCMGRIGEYIFDSDPNKPRSRENCARACGGEECIKSFFETVLEASSGPVKTVECVCEEASDCSGSAGVLTYQECVNFCSGIASDCEPA
jgi:hypothetical protein